MNCPSNFFSHYAFACEQDCGRGGKDLALALHPFSIRDSKKFPPFASKLRKQQRTSPQRMGTLVDVTKGRVAWRSLLIENDGPRFGVSLGVFAGPGTGPRF